MKKLFEIKYIKYLLLISATMIITILIYKLCQICSFSCCIFETLAPYNLGFLFTACIGLLTLFVAAKTLEKQLNMDCINSLAKLREQLTSARNRKVHFMLSEGKDKKTLSGNKISKLKDEQLQDCEDIPVIDIYNYIGTLELGVNMVRKGLINMDDFYNQFGYRIINIWQAKTEEQKKVWELIKEEADYYDDLYWIIEEMRKRKWPK